jgi:Na+/proline symporter
MSENYTIEIKKRSWTEWALWFLWFLAELYVLQNAFASARELEPRAATLLWVIFFVLLIAGGVVWYLRRDK